MFAQLLGHDFFSMLAVSRDLTEFNLEPLVAWDSCHCAIHFHFGVGWGMVCENLTDFIVPWVQVFHHTSIPCDKDQVSIMGHDHTLDAVV